MKRTIEEVYDRDRQEWTRGVRLTREYMTPTGLAHGTEWVDLRGRYINVCKCGEGHECGKDGYCGS